MYYYLEHNKSLKHKSRRALHGIKLISNYFNKNELKELLTSNFYSILYYNSEVWHIPTLKARLKTKLLSTSAAGIKLLGRINDQMISHERLHKIHGRATPNKVMMYKLSLQLFKHYNDPRQEETWLNLNFQQNFG